MGWETRRGLDYYYRSEREGGRVVKRYLGGGLHGMLAAELAAEEREERAAQRERERAERERWASLEVPAEELAVLTDALAGVALADAGYRRHARGEWRRRRVRHGDDDGPAHRAD